MGYRKRGAEQRSRREVIAMAGGAAAAPLTVPLLIGAAKAQGAETPARRNFRSSPPNIVFIFTDQERYRSEWPDGVRLPAHERLVRTGVTFHNHYCPATMCTSSRSVIVTGLTTPNNGMFENCDVPWVKDLSTSIPTIGHMLRKAGYYTAYQGKWHLNRKFDNEEPDRLLTGEMEQYGFADYFSPGDIIGHTLGGYEYDHLVASSAVTWLRKKARHLTDENKPWSLFVSLVNPHDVMYINTDLPGQNVQVAGKLMKHAARAPNHPIYKATWDMPLPGSLREPLDAPGRPRAHGEFIKVWDYVLGHIPLEEDRWRQFNDYYINCTRNVDGHVGTILQELDALGLAENTIIVFTSDHGEAAGAHGLHGKGPFAYQETMHLPLYIVHPDVNGGQDCRSLTAHIDFVPTLLAMAGVQPEKVAEFAGRDLPGKDISKALGNPRAADIHAVRESVLFTYSGLMTNDSGIFQVSAELMAAGKDPKVELKKQGYKPDMKKRGSLRTVFDGRYKFSRYFSPIERNRSTTIDELYRWNDVELFDLANDPEEVNNLGANRAANSETIMTMNGKLEAVIKTEIGVDDGREMPDIPNVDWKIERVDL